MIRLRTLIVAAAAVAITVAYHFLFKEAPRSSIPDEPKKPVLLDKVISDSYTKLNSNDPTLAALINRNLEVSKRLGSDISAKLPKVYNPADFPALIQCLSDPFDEDVVRNEIANLLSRSDCPDLVNTLIQILDNSREKSRFRAFATQHLGGQLDKNITLKERVTAKLRSQLSDKDVSVQRESLLALIRQKDPHACDVAVQRLNDSAKESDAMRDLVIRCIFELDIRDQIPTVRKYARDPDEVIRIAAIVALGQWGDEQSRLAFEEAATSPSVRLQRAGKAALQRIDTVK
jgi:HEAT repeat protein